MTLYVSHTVTVTVRGIEQLGRWASKAPASPECTCPRLQLGGKSGWKQLTTLKAETP